MFSNNFKVFDIHAHLPSPKKFSISHDDLNEYNAIRDKRFKMTWDFPFPSDKDEIEKIPIIDRWVQELDKYNIGGLNFLTAFSNDDLTNQISKHKDRFTGFAHHPIENEDVVEQLERGIFELGLKGYKLFGPLVNQDLDDPQFNRVWQFLADHKIPVLIHFGLLGKAGGIVQHRNINPLAIFNVAKEYPDIPFIIPHFGAGYFQELLHLCWSCPNVYIDTSGSNQWVRWMPYHLDLETLFRKTYELIGSERIIFGTDSNGFPRGYAYRYLQDQLRVCRNMNMKETDIENIFGNNARNLLGLISKEEVTNNG